MVMEVQRSNCEKYICIPISKLLEMIPELPYFQRLMDEKRVNTIFYEIKQIIDKKEEPYLPGCLVIVKTPSKRYLLDGNHRFHIYEKLYKELHFNCNIVCNEITVDSEEEAKKLFTIVNNVVPIPEMPDGIDLNSVHIIAKYFFDKYPNIFSNSKTRRCFRPHLHRDIFQENIGKLLDFLNNKKEIEKVEKIEKEKEVKIDNSLIIQKIENFNEELKHKNMLFFLNTNTESYETFENYRKKAEKKGGFYVGLYNHYNWLFSLFGIKAITDRFQYVKKKIPKALRVRVWNKYMGKNERKGTCPICNEKELKIEDFHCGHDIAESNGGELNVDNLFPVCSLCNLSMGTKTFYEAWKELQSKFD
jgi:hypothetical protein